MNIDGLIFLTFVVHFLTKILRPFIFLPDDNEFEDVNIVRPNDDFYQSRDPDGSW